MLSANMMQSVAASPSFALPSLSDINSQLDQTNSPLLVTEQIDAPTVSVGDTRRQAEDSPSPRGSKRRRMSSAEFCVPESPPFSESPPYNDVLPGEEPAGDVAMMTSSLGSYKSGTSMSLAEHGNALSPTYVQDAAYSPSVVHVAPSQSPAPVHFVAVPTIWQQQFPSNSTGPVLMGWMKPADSGVAQVVTQHPLGSIDHTDTDGQMHSSSSIVQSDPVVVQVVPQQGDLPDNTVADDQKHISDSNSSADEDDDDDDDEEMGCPFSLSGQGEIDNAMAIINNFTDFLALTNVRRSKRFPHIFTDPALVHAWLKEANDWALKAVAPCDFKAVIEGIELFLAAVPGIPDGLFGNDNIGVSILNMACDISPRSVQMNELASSSNEHQFFTLNTPCSSRRQSKLPSFKPVLAQIFKCANTGCHLNVTELNPLGMLAIHANPELSKYCVRLDHVADEYSASLSYPVRVLMGSRMQHRSGIPAMNFMITALNPEPAVAVILARMTQVRLEGTVLEISASVTVSTLIFCSPMFDHPLISEASRIHGKRSEIRKRKKGV